MAYPTQPRRRQYPRLRMITSHRNQQTELHRYCTHQAHFSKLAEVTRYRVSTAALEGSLTRIDSSASVSSPRGEENQRVAASPLVKTDQPNQPTLPG